MYLFIGVDNVINPIKVHFAIVGGYKWLLTNHFKIKFDIFFNV